MRLEDSSDLGTLRNPSDRQPPNKVALLILVILHSVGTLAALAVTFLLGMSVARCNGITIRCDHALLQGGQNVTYLLLGLVLAGVIFIATLQSRSGRRAYWVPVCGAVVTALVLGAFAVLVYVATGQTSTTIS
jgi:hypothetical protein